MKVASLKSVLLTSISMLLILISCNGTAQNKKDKEKPWKFVAFGDCRGHSAENGVNVPVLKKLVDEIVKQDVDLVMFTGDICYGHANRKDWGDQKALENLEEQMMTFRNTIEPLYQNKIKVYLVRGNHEATQRYPDLPGTADHRPIWPETKKIWDKVFSGTYQMPQNGPKGEKNVTFFAKHKNSLIVGLDVYTARDDRRNPDGSIPKPSTKTVNQKWLDTVLRENPKMHVFSFTHEPAFKAGHKDCLHGDMSYGLDYSRQRDQFWNRMYKAGSRVYFCGHDHGYATAAISNPNQNEPIYQMIVGTAGAGKNIEPVYDGYNSTYTIKPIDESKAYGFVIGEVDGNTVRMTYRYLNEENDSFANRKQTIEYTRSYAKNSPSE